MALGVRLRVLDSASVGLRACVKLHGAPLLLPSGLGAPGPREEVQVNHSGVQACVGRRGDVLRLRPPVPFLLGRPGSQVIVCWPLM